MAESLTSASEKAGLPPGSLVHVGEVPELATRITVVDYSVATFDEKIVETIEDILKYRDIDSTTWVNIEGLIDVHLIESVGRHFDIHPLVLEDILNTHQRPKFEEHDDYLYMVMKSLSADEEVLSVNYEQVSILVLHNFVFTFKEKQDDIFEPVKHQLKTSKGRFRSQGSDYLAYVILDNIVDKYFPLQDALDEIIESLEEDLLTNPGSSTLAVIQRIKRELISIRRSVSPIRDLLSGLLRCESPLIKDGTKLYLRDVHDHALRVTEAIDSHRDIVTGLLDIYISSISNKMNEVMKVLTVFASIFIPLTFIVGIYGMNFEYMPELKWRWAYPTLWVGFIVIPVVLLVYFKRKKWL